jgi:hypothetical protein
LWDPCAVASQLFTLHRESSSFLRNGAAWASPRLFRSIVEGGQP